MEVHRIRLKALELSEAAGDIYSIMTISYKLAISLREQGRLQQVIKICQQRLQLVEENKISRIMVGWIFSIWGEVLAEMNDLDEALVKARKGVELTERDGDVDILSWSYLCLIRVYFSRGDIASAIQIIQKMANIAREYVVTTLMTSRMEAWRARVWLAQEKLEDAVQWVLKRSLDTTEELTYVGGFEYIALSRILFAQSRLDETTELLHRLLKAAEAEGHTSRVIEIMILQALTFQTAEDTAQAITTLEKALSLAEPGGFIRIFVDEGTPLEALLKKIRVEDGRIKKYIHKLLAAFKGNKTQLSTDGQQPLVEPLSERELEVLDLIAKGLSNQQVASRLFLSLNTIKSHTRNIHQKLGVNSRTQAVASAKSLGIIPPDNVQ